MMKGSKFKMPIVKHISIHTTPLSSIEYIVNGDKTDEMKYVSGINCPTEVNQAYDFFRRSFEKYSGERFYKKTLNENVKKEKVRLHHYIQSFSPEEKITPEQAHEIGKEWAKKMFGENFQVIISTHIDKEHIHNHFAVSPYSVYGEKWNDNMQTLNKCRKLSDEISRQHGISIIENPKNKNTLKYNEWLARQEGRSWKQQLADDIDKIILQNDVQTINDLSQKLKEQNYDVTIGKYLTIKLKTMERGIRSFRLGDGYAVPELQYRIEHKEKEISDVAISSLKGEAKIYALYMRQMQIQVFRHKTKKVTYSDLTKSANLLTYIVKNGIASQSDFEQRVNDADERYKSARAERQRIENDILKNQNNPRLQNELDVAKERESETKKRRKEISTLYKTFLQHQSDNVYESIRNKYSENDVYRNIEINKDL